MNRVDQALDSLVHELRMRVRRWLAAGNANSLTANPNATWKRKSEATALARAAKCSPASAWRFLHDKNAPDLRTYVKIALLLNCHLELHGEYGPEEDDWTR